MISQFTFLIGKSILDLSRVLMQGPHYNYIKSMYADKAQMLLIDAGSLMFKIETENVYEDLYKGKELFDFSNYSKDWK